ncbi:TPA: hypothetical protein LA462_002272 [Clostridium botulinum]|nr:hypothetical protein [Clostridium botulinum]
MRTEDKRLEKGLYAWKEICELHDWKTSGGTYRKARERELSTMYDWNKETRKIRINEVYNEKIPKEDNRGKSGRYGDDIQELLIKSLFDTNDNEVVWSINTILEKISMININYIKYRKDMDGLSKETGFDKSYIEDFYSYNHRGLRQKVETALNNLRKRSLVMWSKITMIDLWEVEITYSEMGSPAIDENGQVICTKKRVFRKASKNECRVILKMEKRALEKLKCNDKGQIVGKGLWKEFNELIYNGLSHTGICFYYNAYEIIFNRDIIEKEVIGDLGVLYTKNSLNNNICDCLIKCATTRHENALEKRDIVLLQSLGEDEISESSFEKNKLLCSEKFIDINGKLVDKLIKIK